jgi:hypothetical protein
MTKSALVLVLTLALAGCSNSDSDKKDSGKKPGFGGSVGSPENEREPSSVESNSPASCGDQAPFGATILSSSWSRDLRTADINYHQILRFEKDLMSNRVECSVQGQTFIAQAEARVGIDSVQSAIRIYENKVDTRYLTIDGTEYSCTAAITPDLSFAYQLRGNCLIVVNNNEQTVFSAGQ